MHRSTMLRHLANDFIGKFGCHLLHNSFQYGLQEYTQTVFFPRVHCVIQLTTGGYISSIREEYWNKTSTLSSASPFFYFSFHQLYIFIVCYAKLLSFSVNYRILYVSTLGFLRGVPNSFHNIPFHDKKLASYDSRRGGELNILPNLVFTPSYFLASVFESPIIGTEIFYIHRANRIVINDLSETLVEFN